MRQVLISCPVTGDLVPTGKEATSLEALEHTDQLLIDCLGCGQDHGWNAFDATVTSSKSVMSSQQGAW